MTEGAREPAGPPRYGFDLESLSKRNYARHRRFRWAALSVGLALIALFVFLGVEAILLAERRAEAVGYLNAAAAFFVCPLIGFWAAGPYRDLATPPYFLEVGPDGLRFRFGDGWVHTVRWAEDFGVLHLLDRSAQPGVPDYAFYRLRVISRWYELLFWRRTLPVTYLPANAVPQILDSARKAGLAISTVPFAATDSGRALAFFRSGGVTYVIQGGLP